MLGSAIFELILGLVFIFLTVSLIASAIGDKISEWLQWRAAFLEKGLCKMILSGQLSDVAQSILQHPAVQAQVRKPGPVTQFVQSIVGIIKSPHKSTTDQGNDKWLRPDSIPPNTFALALLQIVAPPTAEDVNAPPRPINMVGGSSQLVKDTSVADLRSRIEQSKLLEKKQLKDTLLTLLNKGEANFTEARTNIEKWFDSSMEQVSELYKSRMRWVAFVIGLVVSIVMNVDTIVLANSMWKDASLRASLVAAATKVPQPTSGKVEGTSIDEQLKAISSLDLPVGWKTCPNCSLILFGWTPKEWAQPADVTVKDTNDAFPGFALKLIGWVVTGIAAAQGAPFWYDTLKKLTRTE